MTKTHNCVRRSFLVLTFALALLAAACGSDDLAFDDLALGDATVIDAADVSFVEISPFARFGPGQGDFTAGGHGTFGIFGAGQASPPHTHSGAYHAVVLEGGDMSNPFGTEAEPATLEAGSFWSVPADAEHVTACLDPDQECRFFFHASGPFDFFPLDAMTEDRDDAAQSIPAGGLVFDDLEPYDGAALVWGNHQSGPHGTIVRVDAGEKTDQLVHRNAFSAVPATGLLTVEADDTSLLVSVGSILELEANTPHSLSCASGTDCLIYVFSDHALEIQT